MTKRPGLNKEKLVEAAIVLIDKKGLASLSIASLAAHFKVKPPSLYNHIDNLEDLRKAVALRAIEALTAAGQKAAMGRAGSDALRAVAVAYRDFARRHPGLYQLTQRSYEGVDDALAQAGLEAVEVIKGILRGYNLDDDQALHAVRCLRSSLHGFVSLEMQGGMGLPYSVDTSFELLIEILDRGLRLDFG